MRTLIITSIILFLNLINCNSQITNNYVKAMSSLKLNDLSSAKSLFYEAVNNNEYLFYSYLYKGITEYRMNSYTEANSDIQNSIEQGNIEGYLWQSKVYSKKEDFSLAISSLKNYLSKNTFYSVKEIVSDTSFKALIQTEEWLDFVAGYNTDKKQEYAEEIIYQLDKENLNDAAKVASNALSDYPKESYFYFLSGNIYEKENNYPMAIHQLKTACSFNPSEIDYKIKLGELLCESDESDEALILFSEILEVDPARFEVYIKKANILIKQNKNQEALELIKAYNSFNNSNSDELYLTAKSLYDLKDYKNGLQTINKLFEEDEIEADWYLLRGLIYYELGYYKYAASDLSMTLDLDPNNKEGNYMLGKSYFKLNNTKKACYYWQRAINAGEYRAIEEIQENCE